MTAPDSLLNTSNTPPRVNHVIPSLCCHIHCNNCIHTWTNLAYERMDVFSAFLSLQFASFSFSLFSSSSIPFSWLDIKLSGPSTAGWEGLDLIKRQIFPWMVKGQGLNSSFSFTTLDVILQIQYSSLYSDLVEFRYCWKILSSWVPSTAVSVPLHF